MVIPHDAVMVENLSMFTVILCILPEYTHILYDKMAAVRGQFSEPAKRFTSEEILSHFFIDKSVVESDKGDNHCQNTRSRAL